MPNGKRASEKSAGDAALRIEPPRFADGVGLFVLDDTGIVFSEAAQEIYELNTTATFVWCQIEEGLASPDLARALADTFGFTPVEAERHVQEALADWRSRGFLAGAAQQPMGQMADSPPEGAAPNLTNLLRDSDAATSRRYRVFDKEYRVFFANHEIEAWVHPVLEHLEGPEPPQGDDAGSVSVSPEPDGFLVAQAGGPAYRCARLDEVAPLARWVIFSDAWVRAEQGLAIHAGAVCDGERALILPGRAGSGKTTLTAALVHAGLGYLSDDSVLLETDGSKVRGVPFSICVKESGLHLLADRFPALLDLPVHTRPDGKRVRYLPIAQDRRGRDPKVAWIVFPRYDPAGANELRPMPPGAAIVELTKNASLIRTVTKEQVGELVALLKRVPCFEIRVSSLEGTAKVLQALWA
jgi:hypothetical protein